MSEAGHRSLVATFSRYLLAGGTAAAVDIGGFALLLSLGVMDVLAAVLSFLVATVVNFSLSARYVFGGSTSFRTYLFFLLGASVGLMVNVGVTVGVMRLLSVPAILAKVAGIGCALCLNFVVNRMIVFRPGARA